MIKSESNSGVIKKRAYFLAVFLLVVGLAIILRLADLQIVSGAEYKELAEDQYSFYRKLTPNRGEIRVLDKNTGGSYIVASNIKKPLVYAVPKDMTNSAQVADELAKILQVDVGGILPKLTDNSRGYVVIKRQLSEEQEKVILEKKLQGIGLDYEYSRFYPENTLLSQVLGFVGFKGDEKVGLYGLERYFENNLKGKPGSLSGEKGVGGAWIFGSKRSLEPATDGDNLILTVDRTIQFKAETIIRSTVETHQADSGQLIVMDPKTGNVLAMAGFPDYNPNEYGKVVDSAVFANKSTQSPYEPGSVFKAFTMAASLNEGKITPESTYTDEGEVKVDEYTIMNSDKKAHGLQTMTQVLEESLNTGVIYAKDQIGNQTFLKYIKAFGFGKPTEIELPEATGNLDNLKANIKVNFHTASFGQGISVTPIQLVQAFGALANKGVMMQPHIIASRIEPNGKINTTEQTPVTRVISEKAAAQISAMLVSVVENGHGKRAGVKGYYIAGKTGTAQVPKSDGRGYEENNNIGSFAGYGPVEDPRFVMLVRVNHPRTVNFAESTAAPAFGEMAQFLLNYYNIPPSRK